MAGPQAKPPTVFMPEFPDLNHQQFLESVELARQATQRSGDYSKSGFVQGAPGQHGNPRREHMLVPEDGIPKYDAPRVSVELGKHSRSTDLSTYNLSKNRTYSSYDVKVHEIVSGPHRKSPIVSVGQDTVIRVKRSGPGGEYTHDFKDPSTALKFGSLIAKHVAKRAENKTHQQKSAA